MESKLVESIFNDYKYGLVSKWKTLERLNRLKLITIKKQLNKPTSYSMVYDYKFWFDESCKLTNELSNPRENYDSSFAEVQEAIRLVK